MPLGTPGDRLHLAFPGIAGELLKSLSLFGSRRDNLVGDGAEAIECLFGAEDDVVEGDVEVGGVVHGAEGDLGESIIVGL